MSLGGQAKGYEQRTLIIAIRFESSEAKEPFRPDLPAEMDPDLLGG